MAENMSIDRKDPTKEESDDSMASSPEAEPHQQSRSGSNNNTASNSGTTGTSTTTPQETQAPKRKGGRKPIYATSEERKQRNRQAQAAFRERRTEYIKQLEETIRVHESNLHNLQAAHRSAADECLMLRYKNSLLERILLEKGIDVQAELRDKTGSPTLGPTHVPQNMVQPPQIHRAILNRHQSRRSASSIAPKVEPGIAASVPPPLHARSSAASPKSQPTPPSIHANSPTAAGSGFGPPIGTSSVTSDANGLRSTIPMKPLAMSAPQRPLAPTTTAAATTGFRAGGTAGPYYPTPSFQNHIQQLEQEYDAQADMIDDPEAETPGPGPYPSNYAAEPQPMAVSPTTATSISTTSGPAQHMPPPGVAQSQPAPPGQYPSMTQLLDPGMDWDPFGLSASMQFPTQFSFDTSNMR